MAPRTPQEVLPALHRLYALRLSWSDPRPKPMGWQDIGPRLEALRPLGAPRPDLTAPAAPNVPPRRVQPQQRASRPRPDIRNCPHCGRGVLSGSEHLCGYRQLPFSPRYESRWTPIP